MIYCLKFLIALIVSMPLYSFSQTFTVKGRIIDSGTHDNLPGASVYVVETKHGTASDEKGYYFLNLPAGNYTLRFSYVGYSDIELKISLNSPLVKDVSLQADVLLPGAVVSARAGDYNISNTTMGVERLSMKEVRLLPAIMGEVDILKTIRLLPGVQSVSETSTGFSVRGGSPDQNLILLDNTTVYNPSHLVGFFSTFNNDVISGIELYKGHFPSRHGGRLSSLLEVQTRDEIPHRINGTGGIGLISSRLMAEGPLGQKTSWMIAARRTYADIFLIFAREEDMRKASMYFYDLNGKLTHRFSEKDKLELNIYNGLDKMASAPGYFNYGNTVSSLTWSRVFSANHYGKFSIHFTDYSYNLGSNLNNSDVDWKSRIRDWAFRSDFHRPINSVWNLSYGISCTHHIFSPGEIRMTGLNLQNYVIPSSEATEYGAYLSNEQTVSEKLSLKYGLRFSAFQNSGSLRRTYTGLEPSLGAVYKLTPLSSIKANCSRNIQYLQLANNSSAGSPFDVWFHAGQKVKPQEANVFSAGYFHNFKDNMYETSVEIYYKDLQNVIDFREHSSLLLNQHLEDEIRSGTGQACGLELMVRKNSGRFTGFVNYTLSRSERTIAEVNKGKTYLAPYDRTHAINVVASFNLSSKVNISVIWVFATGMPCSYPTGRFAVGDEYFPIYSGRNEYRKPDYHRMDVSLNFIPRPKSKRWLRGEWNFSIYNAYNRKNPWMINYQQDKTTGIPYAEMTYMFAIVPSITYNFKF
ncbi:MAG: TonB-dependent receptor [Prevotellaceae bacterium]|jgi:hypothetical protein|nr:TonB-dependent receptor [Prevotellaceae bacterium]